jgi:hypothetical protein
MKVKLEFDTYESKETKMWFDDIEQKDIVEIQFHYIIGKTPELGVKW